MTEYTHIVSLGFFCSTASELEKIGLRDASYPFDWLISDFKGVIECIQNDFQDFLKYDNLYQSKNNKNYYLDMKYNFQFFHDFSKHTDLSSQLPSVFGKYNRRIDRFKQNILDPTLFLRYIENQKELDYIEQNYKDIVSLLKSKNSLNDIIFISNDNIKSDLINIYGVKKDENDSVARNFLEKNERLKQFLCSSIYDENKRMANIKRSELSQNRKRKSKHINIFKRKLNNLLKKTYTHNHVVDRNDIEP